MSVLFASIGIGLVLGWAGAPRPLAEPFVWSLGLVVITLTVLLADWISPARATPALASAAVGWSLHSFWLGALSARRKGT